MPIDRFYFDGPLTPNIVLIDSEFHHLRVIKIAIGEQVEVVNGHGSIAKAKLISISKKSATLELFDLQNTIRPPYHFILAVPLMMPSKLELVTEKCTELGADAFYFYRADHSEKTDLSEKALERLRNITISALKQSGRLFLPTLELLPSLERVFHTEGLFLFGDISPMAPSIAKEKVENAVIFITGPERGFSKKEEVLLSQRAKGISLNTNVLRAETAPIAAMSCLSVLALPNLC